MKILEPRFRRPEGYIQASYRNASGAHIRYGSLKSNHERAVAVFIGGQTGIIEEEFENALNLAALGITTHFVERHGDGGSERCYADPQKPPALPHESHVADLNQFITEIAAPAPDRPLLGIGHCLGGLITLRTMQAHDNLFDHCILTSPMLGMLWPRANGDQKEAEWAARDITQENETAYIGRARDWSWELAEKLIATDQTSHDPVRGSLHHYLRRDNPDLRLGGITEGNVIQNSRSLRTLFQPGVLEAIQTPITIISAPNDVISDVHRHWQAAAQLHAGRIISIPDARHGLWREADAWRDQLLGHVDAIVTETCKTQMPRRVKAALWKSAP